MSNYIGPYDFKAAQTPTLLPSGNCQPYAANKPNDASGAKPPWRLNGPPEGTRSVICEGRKIAAEPPGRLQITCFCGRSGEPI